MSEEGPQLPTPSVLPFENNRVHLFSGPSHSVPHTCVSLISHESLFFSLLSLSLLFSFFEVFWGSYFLDLLFVFVFLIYFFIFRFFSLRVTLGYEIIGNHCEPPRTEMLETLTVRGFLFKTLSFIFFFSVF